MSSNTIAIIEMLSLLNCDTYNVKRMVEKTGLAPTTVVRYFKLLRKKRLIRIAEWKKYGNCHIWVPHYEWNNDEISDAKKPKPMSDADRSKRYRMNKSKVAVMGVMF